MSPHEYYGQSQFWHTGKSEELGKQYDEVVMVVGRSQR